MTTENPPEGTREGTTIERYLVRTASQQVVYPGTHWGRDQAKTYAQRVGGRITVELALALVDRLRTVLDDNLALLGTLDSAAGADAPLVHATLAVLTALEGLSPRSPASASEPARSEPARSGPAPAAALAQQQRDTQRNMQRNMQQDSRPQEPRLSGGHNGPSAAASAAFAHTEHSARAQRSATSERLAFVEAVPEVRFPIADVADATRVAWFAIERSDYGVYVTIHRQDPGPDPTPTAGVATVHVDYFEDRVAVQLWDEAVGPAGDIHWRTPAGDEITDAVTDTSPNGGSIVLVRHLLGGQ